jgi:hypothetical protein
LVFGCFFACTWYEFLGLASSGESAILGLGVIIWVSAASAMAHGRQKNELYAYWIYLASAVSSLLICIY